MTNNLQISGSPLPSHRLPHGQATTTQALVDLEQAYLIEEPSEAIGFIQQHSLHDVLLEAREALNAAFGPQATKVLRLVRDPDDGSTSLFCLALVTGSADAALEARWAFERDWWTERCGAATALNFDFELL
jgi:hypothetical protein